MTIVWPRSCRARRRKSSRSAPLSESRLPVGSSANTMAGLLTSARATATRCCCPPESSDGRCVSRSDRPTVSMTASYQSGSGMSPSSATTAVSPRPYVLVACTARAAVLVMRAFVMASIVVIPAARVVRPASALRLPRPRYARSRPAGTHHSGLVREHDELGPVAHVELGHRPVDVCLDSRRAEEQPLGDLVVRHCL